MFKVIQDGMNRYQISIGVGKIFRAKDLKEVKTALEHYFNSKHLIKNIKNCPLCEDD